MTNRCGADADCVMLSFHVAIDTATTGVFYTQSETSKQSSRTAIGYFTPPVILKSLIYATAYDRNMRLQHEKYEYAAHNFMAIVQYINKTYIRSVDNAKNKFYIQERYFWSCI